VSPELAPALRALGDGRLDEAVAALEALADQGLSSTSIAFDRGIAYARRAQSPSARPGDLGRAAHAFEEALRLDPHDGAARELLEQVRREIARRDARASGKAEELSAESPWRAIVTAAPPDTWAVASLAGSAALSALLLLVPRSDRVRRRVLLTAAAVLAAVLVGTTTLGLSAWDLRAHVREAVVIAQRPTATSLDGAPFDLDEGMRVDVLEEGATAARIRTDKGEAWVPRAELRLLPPHHP
jgi:hypothetical protein